MWVKQRRIDQTRTLAVGLVNAVLFWGCTGADVKPVDIYPEDMCAFCRMAVSDERCASELITEGGEVFKFDDIGCMEAFTAQRNDILIAGTFYKEFSTKKWIASTDATVVTTSVTTPMGSGKVAFADRTAADEFQRRYPVKTNNE